MSNVRFSQAIDTAETADGVRYLLRTSGGEPSNFSFALGFVLRIPLAAAGLAVWFLWQNFRQVPLWLSGLAGLFVAQMLFAARVPWTLFRRSLWQQLVAVCGHGEIELRGDRLFSGHRVGIFRSGQTRNVADFRRIVVYVYDEQSAPPAERDPTVDSTDPQPAAERAVLAIETSAKAPWLLVDGFSRGETLALAEDLQRRIAAAARRQLSPPALPQVAVIKTDSRTLYPPLPPDFYRRRKPWWLAIHLAGAAGLGALTAIAVEGGAWQISAAKFAIIFGWLLEFALVAITLSLSGASATESHSA